MVGEEGVGWVEGVVEEGVGWVEGVVEEEVGGVEGSSKRGSKIHIIKIRSFIYPMSP